MKSIIYLIGLGLLLMVGAVGCEIDEHEHHGGGYDGYYQGYGHEYHAYPDYDDYHHH